MSSFKQMIVILTIIMSACTSAQPSQVQSTEPIPFVPPPTKTPFQFETNTPVVIPAVPVPETPTSALMMQIAPEEVTINETLVGIESGNSIVDCHLEGWKGGKFSYDIIFNDVTVNMRLTGISYERGFNDLSANGVTSENNIFYVNGTNSVISVCIDSEGVYLQGLEIPE